MAGPSEIVPLGDVSKAEPEHAEVRPLVLELEEARLLLLELDDVAKGVVVVGDAPAGA